MSEIALIRTTFGDTARAEQVARTVITERLAACATLDQVRSIYRWDGAVEQADEVAVLFKTSVEAAPALRARIAALHDYDVPVIEHWNVETDAPAADWVRNSTGE
ncbi:divalent-cation tolerance protein CutA [soil metagenome]